jgi:hypothetical protein
MGSMVDRRDRQPAGDRNSAFIVKHPPDLNPDSEMHRPAAVRGLAGGRDEVNHQHYRVTGNRGRPACQSTEGILFMADRQAPPDQDLREPELMRRSGVCQPFELAEHYGRSQSLGQRVDLVVDDVTVEIALNGKITFGGSLRESSVIDCWPFCGSQCGHLRAARAPGRRRAGRGRRSALD